MPNMKLVCNCDIAEGSATRSLFSSLIRRMVWMHCSVYMFYANVRCPDGGYNGFGPYLDVSDAFDFNAQ